MDIPGGYRDPRSAEIGWRTMAAGAAEAQGYDAASMGEIASTDHGAGIISETLDECCRVAAKSGCPPQPATLEPIRTLLTDKSSTLKASMLRDLESGSRIEAGHIVGDLIRRAAQLGVAVPNLTIAYSALQAYESRRAVS